MFPLPDETIAKHLALKELRVGAARTEGRGSHVLAWWLVSVEPSFDSSWAIGALHEEEWTGGPTPDRVTVRGFVVDADGAAVAPLHTDEVLVGLGTLNPFQVEPTRRVKVCNADIWCEMATVDGLGYRLRWGTRADEGAFRCSNPEADWLVEFERVLFRFAHRVVTDSAVVRFEEQLRCWAEYRDGLGGTPPT